MGTVALPIERRIPEVLFVDDEPSYLESVKAAAAKAIGFRVATASSADKVMSIVQNRKLAAVVCDLKMPGIGGVSLLEKIRACAPGLPLAIQTGYALTRNDRARLDKIGALSYTKDARIVEVVRMVLERATAAMEDVNQLEEKIKALKALNQRLLADLKASLSQIPNPTQAIINDELGGSYSVADLISDIDDQNARGQEFIDWWLKARQRLRSMGKLV